MNEPIARLPTQSIDDEWCSICTDDNVVIVIKGGSSLYGSCENHITLCSKCYYKMQNEIDVALNNHRLTIV